MKESYMSLLACQLAITGVLMKYPSKHFKIGKTAQLNPYDRFDEEYRQKYSLFKLIYGNETLALIDELEQELIAYYIGGKTKCVKMNETLNQWKAL